MSIGNEFLNRGRSAYAVALNFSHILDKLMYNDPLSPRQKTMNLYNNASNHMQQLLLYPWPSE